MDCEKTGPGGHEEGDIAMDCEETGSEGHEEGDIAMDCEKTGLEGHELGAKVFNVYIWIDFYGDAFKTLKSGFCPLKGQRSQGTP